jgi:hypothetical protein
MKRLPKEAVSPQPMSLGRATREAEVRRPALVGLAGRRERQRAAAVLLPEEEERVASRGADKPGKQAIRPVAARPLPAEAEAVLVEPRQWTRAPWATATSR